MSRLIQFGYLAELRIRIFEIILVYLSEISYYEFIEMSNDSGNRKFIEPKEK